MLYSFVSSHKCSDEWLLEYIENFLPKQFLKARLFFFSSEYLLSGATNSSDSQNR